jgi:hypothetical protein
VAHGGRGETHTGVWWGKPNGNELLGRPWHRWKDNIKMNIKEGGWKEMDWMNMVEGGDNWQAALNTVTIGKLP